MKPPRRQARQFFFGILDQELPLAEDWAVLETYLGALGGSRTYRARGKKRLKQLAAKVISRHSGKLFELLMVCF